MLRRDFLTTAIATPLLGLIPKKTRRVAVICYTFNGPHRSIGFYQSHKDDICLGHNPDEARYASICGPQSSPRELIMIMSVFCKTESHPLHVVEFNDSPGYFSVIMTKNEDDLLHLADKKDLLQVTYSHMDV